MSTQREKSSLSLGDALRARVLRWFASLRPKTDPPTAATTPPIAPSHGPKYDDVRKAVLAVVYNDLRISAVGVGPGVFGQADVDRVLGRIEHYRGWLKSQDDPMIVRAYKHWLDHYEEKARETQVAIDADRRGGFLKRRDAIVSNYKATLERAGKIPRP